jgi:hypothetical protein
MNIFIHEHEHEHEHVHEREHKLNRSPLYKASDIQFFLITVSGIINDNC